MQVGKLASALMAVLVSMGVQHAYARECRLSGAESSTANSYLQAIQGRVDPSRCDSMVTVLRKLVSNHRTGGRQLEPDKPISPDVVRAQMQEAMADPAFAHELKGLESETDPLRRTILEAILFDAYGWYAARDARLATVIQPGSR